MHKIPTLILALFILASNLVVTPTFAIGLAQNRVSVSAYVEEQISVRINKGVYSVSTNSTNGFWVITNNSSVFNKSKTFKTTDYNKTLAVSGY